VLSYRTYFYLPTHDMIDTWNARYVLASYTACASSLSCNKIYSLHGVSIGKYTEAWRSLSLWFSVLICAVEDYISKCCGMIHIPSELTSHVTFWAQPFRIIFRVSLQLAQPLAKCPWTLEIVQFTPSFSCCNKLNWLLYGISEEI